MIKGIARKKFGKSCGTINDRLLAAKKHAGLLDSEV
jgi:hypothetical protein